MLSSSLLTRTLRSTTLRSTHLSRPLSTSPPLLSSLLRSTPPRFETSKVAQQPASKNVKEMGKNALEEAKGVAGTVAEAVSGGNDVVSQAAPKKNFGAGDVTEDLVRSSVSLPCTVALAHLPPPSRFAESYRFSRSASPSRDDQVGRSRSPPLPRYLRRIGLLLSPSLRRSATRRCVFLAFSSLVALFLDLIRPDEVATVQVALLIWPLRAILAESSDISVEAAQAMLEHVNLLQVQYGAIILSFLGAVHWGLEWSKFGGVVGDRRYILGIAPVLAGWSTLLFAGPLALVGQWAAFFGMWYADQRATTNGWTPRWYSTVRFLFFTSPP